MFSTVKDFFRGLISQTSEVTGTDNLYIARGGFWASLPLVVSTVLSAGLLVAFANLVPREVYGAYKYVLSIAGSIGFLTLTGMNTAVTQMVARGVDGALAWSVRLQLRWNALYAATAFTMAAYYAWQGNINLALGLIIIGLSFPVQASLNTYGAYLGGKREFRRAAIYGASSSVFFAGVMICAVLVTDRAPIFVLAYALGNLVPAIYFYVRTSRSIQAGKPTSEEQAELTSYARHLSFLNIFATISNYLDKIILFQTIGAVELAVYSIAQAVPERVKGFAKSFTSILLPKLSGRTIAEIRSVFHIRVFQGIATGLGLFSLYWFIAPPLFSLVLPKYLESIAYSRAIMFSFAFTIPGTYVSSVFRSQQMLRAIYISSIFGHAGLIVMYALLGPTFGIWGMVWSQITIFTAGTVLNSVLWEVESRRLIREA